MNLKSLYARSLLTIAAILLLALAAALVNGMVLREDAKTRLSEVLHRDLGALWNHIIQGQYSAMSSGITTLTRNRDALKAVRSGDRKALAEAALPTYRRLDASGVIEKLRVLDTSGEVLLSAPDDVSGKLTNSLVTRALTEQKQFQGRVLDREGKPQVVIVFPLYARGQMIGAGIFQRSPEAAVAALHESAGVDVFVLDNDNRLINASNAEMADKLALDVFSEQQVVDTQTVDDLQLSRRGDGARVH